MALIATCIALALSLAVIRPLPLSWRGRLPLHLLAWTIAFKFQVVRWLGGPIPFAPRLPAWIVLPAGWLFAIALFLALAAIALLPLRLVLFHARPGLLPPRRLHQLHLAALCLAIFAASLGLFLGRRPPRIHRLELAFPNLPQEAEGMTIALLTDLHADGITGPREIGRMVRLANALKPDLILLGGDLVDGTVEMRMGDMAPLKELSAPLGVWAVPGNHEYYSGFPQWRNAFPQLGIRLLVNEHTTLPQGIVLAGLSEKVARKYGEEPPRFEKALAGVPEDAFVVMAAHNPNLAHLAAQHKIPLLLCGHTHGGMVWGLDLLVRKMNKGFLTGLYVAPPETQVVVSNGAGIWNGFPLRIGHPSEIPLITLKRKER